MSRTISLLAPCLGLALLALGACVEQDGLDPQLGSAAEEAVVLNNQTITELCVEVSDKDNAGTTNAIELDYLTQTDDFWSCNLSSGASRGDEACCTPTHGQKDNNTAWGEYFYVQFLSSSSTDGLRIGGVSATGSNGTFIHYGTFHKDADIDTADCTNNYHCASFWIDGDDHKGCWHAKLSLDDDGLAWPDCVE